MAGRPVINEVGAEHIVSPGPTIQEIPCDYVKAQSDGPFFKQPTRSLDKRHF
jgi:hypothetical protein